MTQKKYDRAERLYRRSIDTPESTLADDDPNRLVSLFGLGNVYLIEGIYEKAEPCYKKVLKLAELRPANPALHADLLENYAALLRKTKRDAEAVPLETKAKEIRTKAAKRDTSERRESQPKR
jgi:tetratricopeptide (TPR) repeat protein